MAAFTPIDVRCSLPINRGDENTDIVVFNRGESVICILATTAPNDITLSFSSHQNAACLATWPQEIPAHVAKDVVLWATRNIKEPHIRSKCALGSNMESMRDMILGMIPVSVMHPSAIFGPDTLIFPAYVRSTQDGHNATNVLLRADMPTSTQTTDAANRPASMIVWAYSSEYVQGILRIPYPRIDNAKMNTTVMVLGNLAHAKLDIQNTFIVKPMQGEMPSALDGCDIRTTTITYLPLRGGEYFPRGLFYSTGAMPHVGDGKELLTLSGIHAIDNTALGFVRFAEYANMCVPLVCGCAVRDVVRFERAHIPLVFTTTNASRITFEDVSYGVIQLFENDKPRGNIDISVKEKHGSVWWVNLVSI